MSFFHNNVLGFDQELFNPDTVDILGQDLDPIGELSFELPTSNPPAGFQSQADITAQNPAVQQPVDPNLLKQVYAQLLTPYIERHVQTLLQNTSLNQQIISQVVQQPQARPTSPHLPLTTQRPPLPQAAAPIPTIEQIPQTPQQPIQLTISPAAVRESKLQKYRLKRQKRNYNRPVDQDKSRVANARPRDAQGHFLPGKISRRVTSDLMNKLALSESECQKLREDLGNRERTMIELQVQLLQQQIVNEEQQMRLMMLQGLPVMDNQQSINEKRQRLEQMLRILESRTPPQTPLSMSSEPQTPISSMEVLSPQISQVPQSVIEIEDDAEQSNKKKLGGPPSEIYNPPWPRNTMIPAFAEKIDFNKIELKKSLDPPSWVEISKREYMEAQKNWQMRQEEIAKFIAENPNLLIDSQGISASPSKEKLELRKTPQFTVSYNTNAVNNNVNNNNNAHCNNNNSDMNNTPHDNNNNFPAQYIQLGQVMIPTPTAAIWRAALQDPEFVRQHQQQVHFMLD
jgi:hypothetical protein